MKIAEIGALPPTGSCRLSLTDEDKAARDVFVGWCQQAGCAVKIDAYGNIFAIRQGRKNLPAILIGSHLDTQPHGGRFDGVLGVMAGLEIVRTLNDAAIETERPVVIVNWTNEEGVRYQPGLTGSTGFASQLGGAALQAVTSMDGSDFFQELTRIGYAGIDTPPSVAAYLEFHIEQGPVLENMDKTLGIVEGIQGVRWLELELLGMDAHAGTTPMDMRQDSFVAASVFVSRARALASSIDTQIRFTPGRVEVEPNSVNTVAGRTVLTIDLRHTDEAILDEAEAKLMRLARSVASKENVRYVFRQIMNVRSVSFPKDLQANLSRYADELQVPHINLPSGAMHDASSVSTVLPSAMLLVASRGGISHNPLEWSELDHIALGCDVLLRSILDLASIAT